MTVDRLKAPIELLGTGSSALDGILGGGLPARSITLIAGEPGTGKSILALQILFHQARQGRRALYFTARIRAGCSPARPDPFFNRLRAFRVIRRSVWAASLSRPSEMIVTL